jgi:hypothetical protein
MKAAQLAGNYLIQVDGSALPLIYSLVSANVAGHTKKVSMNAIMLMSFCLGNILGPLTFRTKDAPNYTPAKIGIVATLAIAIVTSVLLRYHYIWENRRRNQQHEGEVRQENSGFLNMTDRNNRHFRVSLLIFDNLDLY